MIDHVTHWRSSLVRLRLLGWGSARAVGTCRGASGERRGQALGGNGWRRGTVITRLPRRPSMSAPEATPNPPPPERHLCESCRTFTVSEAQPRKAARSFVPRHSPFCRSSKSHVGVGRDGGWTQYPRYVDLSCPSQAVRRGRQSRSSAGYPELIGTQYIAACFTPGDP